MASAIGVCELQDFGRLSEHERDFQTGIARRFFASPPSARPRRIGLFAIGEEFRLGPSSMHELR